MSRSGRNFLFPVLAVLAALLLAAPASALPVFEEAESGWARFLEPLFRLFVPQHSDSNGRAAKNGDSTGLFDLQGWDLDPNGLVVPPPLTHSWDTDPNG